MLLLLEKCNSVQWEQRFCNECPHWGLNKWATLNQPGSGGINQPVCEQKPRTEQRRWRLFSGSAKLYNPPVEPSGPRMSSPCAAVLMKRIREKSVPICSDSLMDLLPTPLKYCFSECFKCSWVCAQSWILSKETIPVAFPMIATTWRTESGTQTTCVHKPCNPKGKQSSLECLGDKHVAEKNKTYLNL